MPSSTRDAAAYPGRLVSIEGLNGVGKTYLTTRMIKAAADRGDDPPQVIEEFSSRAGSDGDLGRRLLRSLVSASGGERFLRAGFPRSETLLLLAIKMHDYEAALPALLAGRTVIEGRSLHSTAVYQSLILAEDDYDAFALATRILDDAGRWRPLPDLTIVLTDDVDAAVGRAETRNGEPFTAEQWSLHRRAAALFERLAAADPDHVRVLDRREHDADAVVQILTDWIATAPARAFHGHVPATMLP
jgi:dTMP kinase